MAGGVDEVVGAAHDVDVAVLVIHAGIAGLVVAGEVFQIARDIAGIVVPQGLEAAGRQRQAHAHGAGLACRQHPAVVAQDVDAIAGNGLGGRPRLDRQPLQADAVGRHGPAGFGLPPVIDHRAVEQAFGPAHGVGIGALAGQEQGFEAGQVVAGEQPALRVLLLDGAEGGGGGEERLHAVFGDHAPEDAGIRRSHRLALEQNRRVAVEQRRIDDIAVAHHPADVAGRPPAIAGLHAVDGLHRPVERHRMAAIVAHHPLGPAGGAGGVEDIERVGGGHRHPVDRAGGGGFLVPVQVAARPQRRRTLVAGQHHHRRRRVRGDAEGVLQNGQIGNGAPRFDAAAGRQHQLRPGVVQPLGHLGRGEAAEHHRMDGADAGAGQHGDHRLRHRRHVDQHPVALVHAVPAQHAGEGRHLAFQLVIGQHAPGTGDGAVPDQGALAAAAGIHMAVQRIPAGIGLAAREPAIERRRIVVEYPLPAPRPADPFGDLAPIAGRVLPCAAAGSLVSLRHRPSPAAPARRAPAGVPGRPRGRCAISALPRARRQTGAGG